MVYIAELISNNTKNIKQHVQKYYFTHNNIMLVGTINFKMIRICIRIFFYNILDFKLKVLRGESKKSHVVETLLLAIFNALTTKES